MSYTRLCRESDVHVYSDGFQLHCLWCWLSPNGDTTSYTEYPDMIRHLEEHLAAGFKVPEHVLVELRKEAAIHPNVSEFSRIKDEARNQTSS